MQKDALTFALLMGVDAVAVKMGALVLPEGSLDYAFDMAVAKDARTRAAPKAQKVSLASAFHMEVAGAVSTPSALKERKEAPCSARHMVVVNVAPLKGATRVQRGARLFVRVMVVGKDVHSKEVGSARRVFMGGHSSAWRMVVARDVPCRSVPRVQGEELIFVYAMVVEEDAKSKTVEKVLREALISARPTAEGRDALGVSPILNLAKVTVLATHLLEGRLDFVHLMVLLCKTNAFMVVLL